MPPAPGRLSTTTGWPNDSETGTAIPRARMSVPPPGENGEITRTGLTGYLVAQPSGEHPELDATDTRRRAVRIWAPYTKNQMSSAVKSDRKAPRIARVHAVNDIEFDTVRIGILALLLLLSRLDDFAVLQLTAVRETFRDIFGFVGVNRTVLFRLFRSFTHVVRDESNMMQAVDTERVIASFDVENRKADNAIRHQDGADRLAYTLQTECLFIKLRRLIGIRHSYGYVTQLSHFLLLDLCQFVYMAWLNSST